MRWHARVGDRLHMVDLVQRPGGILEASVDGRRYSLNVTEPQPRVYSILEGNASHEAIVEWRRGRCRVRLGAAVFDIDPVEPGRAGPGGASTGTTTITAVMPGRVLRVLVEEGQKIDQREGLLVIEAMKMENELAAPRAGIVKAIRVEPGATVETGDVLVEIQ